METLNAKSVGPGVLLIYFMFLLTADPINKFVACNQFKNKYNWSNISMDINNPDHGRSWIRLKGCPRFLKKAEKVLKSRFPNRDFHWSILKMNAGGLPQVLIIISDVVIQQ